MILDEIVAAKRQELQVFKQQFPEEALREQIPENDPPPFAAAFEEEKLNILAEIKYRSPSRGSFPCLLKPVEIAEQYRCAGAAGLSILTEKKYFAGAPEYLKDVRIELPQIPILRKDFLFEPYQVLESRVWGASAVLAIVACLQPGQITGLLASARECLLDVVVEVHDPQELETAVESGATIIGVNNRNLKDFSVDITTSFEIARRLEGEKGYLLIAESGLSDRTQLLELQDAGFRGFLIGSYFMNNQNPGERLAQLLSG